MINTSLNSIHKYERSQAQKLAPEIEASRKEHEKWRAKKKGLLAALERASKDSKDTAEIEERLDELQGSEPIAPRLPIILRGDDTSENLAFALTHEWPSAAVLNSEAGLIFGSHAMGAEKIMAGLALKNLLWDGEELHIGRKTSASFIVRGARFTFGLQIQRAALMKFAEKNGELARGIGFWARFLFAEPASTQGCRPWKEPPRSWTHLGTFNTRLREILEITLPWDESGTFLMPPVLDFSPKGKEAWVEVYNGIESELAFDGPLKEISDVASKAADNMARLAALFHILEIGLDGEIGPSHVQAAAKIIRWHLNEARRFFGTLQLPPEDQDAANLEEWLLHYCRRDQVASVPRGTVQKGINPRRLRDGKFLDAAIEKLQGLGRARLIVEGKPKLIQVRPELLPRRLQAAA